MMKHIIFTSALLLASTITGEAMAAPVCNGNSGLVNTVAALNTLLSNTTICATKTGGGDEWHEYHNSIGGGGAGSSSFEKIGAGTPADPNVVIGTWTIVNSSPDAHIEYAYTGDATYSYVVYASGSNIELCTSKNGTQIATGTLSAGKVLVPCQ